MIDPTEGLYKNITLNDVQLAAIYYPILVDLAKHKHCLTYGELVSKAKALHPTSPVAQSAIPTSTGRKLDIVRIFTAERGLPDLTSLVISKISGECGDGFTRYFDPVVSRDSVFTFDWGSVSTEFEYYISHTTKEVFPKKKRKQGEASELMFTYYRQHKSNLPSNISSQRELIITLLMEGHSEEDAFTQAANLCIA